MSRILLLWVAVTATACIGGHSVKVNGHSVSIEIAADPEARALGLMNRDSLPADGGMLFVYPDEAPRSFWMKNTRIPLSIAYADSTGKIVKIADMTPYQERPVPSLYPAKYALEVNKGWFEQHEIVAGAMITGLPSVDAK